MSEVTKGAVAMVLACVMWGFQALFYKLLVHVPPMEVLAHRTLWSFVSLVGILIVIGRANDLTQALTDRSTRWRLSIAAVMVACNWGTFVFAVQAGFVAQSSLGYFIFPLVAVLLGTVLLKERLSKLQWIAIGIATLAIIVLAVGVGQMPWIALFLATTFGIYGLVKKPLNVGPITSVCIEALLLAPLALIWIAGVEFGGWKGLIGSEGGFFFGRSDWWLLALCGPLTCVPLVLMTYAMSRLRLSTVGIMQYLNPSLQFALAVLVFAEPITRWHAIAFPMIWGGLAIYTFESIRQERRGKASMVSATVSKIVK